MVSQGWVHRGIRPKYPGIYTPWVHISLLKTRKLGKKTVESSGEAPCKEVNLWTPKKRCTDVVYNVIMCIEVSE